MTLILLLDQTALGVQGTRARGRGVGGVALVLGAGNQASVAPLDVLHKLVAEDTVVVCKMNPVNEYVGPYLRCAHWLLCF